jgi:glycosyltransferase involved in cell wall biosynthesis
MNNRFFFVTTYDNISGKIISSIINMHPDINCHMSYPDPFLPTTFDSIVEPANITLDKFINLNTSTETEFSGNIQRFSAFELQHKKLTEKTAQPFNTANILISPELRINFLLQSWVTSPLDTVNVLDYIEKKVKLLYSQKHNLFERYIRNTVFSEKIADLSIARNKLFIYALAKTIAYDSADIPTPGKKFRFETLLEDPNEFIGFINYLTNNRASFNDDFYSQLKLQEQNIKVSQMGFSKWPAWQSQLLDRFINTKLQTIYYPHLDKALSAHYQEAGYQLSPTSTKESLYSKLISIQLNSNRPAQLASYFDNIEETADKLSDIEVLVNIDIGDVAMRSLLDAEIQTRKFTLKYVQTPRPKSFCDLWKPINKLLEITDPKSYFLLNISDEMLFATKGWDTILKKYVGYFPDHIFRLRASRNKFRNYFDRWECSFAQDAIPITTKKWVDIGGDWNPCFGPDSFQQLISLYLSKEGKFSNSNYLREAPFNEIKFVGDVPAMGIDGDKAWRHHRDHIIAMQICQSYPMQLEARRRAMMIKANIIADAEQMDAFKIIDDKSKKQIMLFDVNNQMQTRTFNYSVNWLAINLTNQWRKLAFFKYFGDGPNHRITIRGFLSYLKARYLWAFKLRKIIKRLTTFHQKRILDLRKKLKFKVKFTHFFKHPLVQENKRLKELYKVACMENENLKNSLIEKWLAPTTAKRSSLQDETNTPGLHFPKISVIVGVLNMENYLAAALDSVIRQNYPNLELIVMDGGSTDGTLNIIKQYEKNITFWKSEKDKGHSDACNRAIEFATGDFITLLNADDILGDNLLNKVALVYSELPYTQVITCGVRIVENTSRKNNHILKEITDSHLLQITLYNMLFELPVINARFFHKDIFKTFGQFKSTHADGSYNLSNDRDFLIRLALAGVQSEIISEPLYTYFSHCESLTFGQKNVIKTHKEHLQLTEEFLKSNSLLPEQRQLFLKWVARESFFLSLTYLKQGKLKNSLATIKYGFSQCGLMWPWESSVYIAKGMRRRLKTLITRQRNLPMPDNKPV